MDTELESHEMTSNILDEGKQALTGYKRKLDMSQETTYEDMFEQTNIKFITTMGHYNNADRSLEFEYAPWSQSVREFTGDFLIDFQVLKRDGTAYAADQEAALAANAWMRPNFMHNMFKSVEVWVNGKPINMDFEYDMNAWMTDLVRVDSQFVEDEKRNTGFGLYKDIGLVSSAGRTNALDDATKSGDLNKPTHAMPSKVQDNASAATAINIKDQSAFNALWSDKIMGSPVIRMKGRIKHPLMAVPKDLPPQSTFTVKMKLNQPGRMFTCDRAQRPSVKIVKAGFLDKLIKLNEAGVKRVAMDIIRNDGMFTLPVQRPVFVEWNVPRNVSWRLNKALTGQLPRRIMVAFVRNGSMQDDSGQAELNPFIFPNLWIKRFVISQDDKEYPYKDGYRMELDREEMSLSTNNPADYDEDDMKKIIARNHTLFEENMRVFAGTKVNHLALKIHDWLTYSNIWCFDFTPLGRVAEMDHVSFPKTEANLKFEIDFAVPPPGDYTMIIRGEYNNQVDINATTWEFTKDW